ncbi:MAG: hypothetical protein V2A70_02195, partial [Candidatus Omnitrophota bacterium]
SIFFFVVLLFAAVPIIFVAVVIFSLRKLNVKGVLQDGVSLRGGNIFGMNAGVIDVNGQQVLMHYFAGRKNNPSRLQLSIQGNFFAHALLRRETRVDQFGKEIGLSQEAQLYDQSFDDAVYIECEDHDFIRRVFGAREMKERLCKVLLDFPVLEIKDNHCLLVKSPCPGINSVSPQQQRLAAETLVDLIQAMPPPVPGQATATPVTDHARASSGLFVGFGVSMIVAGIVLSVWGFGTFEPLEPFQVFMASLKIGIPLLVVYMFFVYGQVKGLSRALRSLAGAFFSALVGIPLLCWGGMMVVNGSQDRSAAVHHTTTVMGKRITHSKNSTSYHVTVMPWRVNRGAYDFTVPYHEYNRINYGDPCVITTREGLFNFHWVVAQKCR